MFPENFECKSGLKLIIKNWNFSPAKSDRTVTKRTERENKAFLVISMQHSSDATVRIINR